MVYDPFMHRIVVHVSVDASTVGYAAFGWKTALELASMPDQLSLVSHCMDGSSAAAMANLVGTTVRLGGNKDHNRIGGSYGHAVCIMDAFKRTNDGNIHVIADTDAVLLAKGWDSYVRSRIDVGVGFLGTTYEDVGGFSSGTGLIQTYKKVPNFIWAALGLQHDWRDLDITPKKEHRVHITDETLSKIYNLPIGFSVFGEAGWQVPRFVHDNGIKYEGFQQLKPTKDATVLQGLTDYSEEYHVDGVPFVVHQRGGRQFAYRTSELSANFFKVVDGYLAEEVKRTPRW